MEQGYKLNTFVQIQPDTKTRYNVCVKARDSKGTVVKKYFDVKVTK